MEATYWEVVMVVVVVDGGDVLSYEDQVVWYSGSSNIPRISNKSP